MRTEGPTGWQACGSQDQQGEEDATCLCISGNTHFPFYFCYIIFSNKCYKKNKDKDCSCTTMGLKEAFISSLLTLYYNICQAYTLISPYFATLARITVKFSAGLQRHLASRFCCLARMCFILLVHHLFVNLYLQMDFMSTVVM